MPITASLVRAHLPSCLSAIVLDYFIGPSENPFDWAELGQWEACMDHPYDLNMMLGGACAGGHLELAKQMIVRGADCWNRGLSQACESGHWLIVSLMIEHGAWYCMACNRSIYRHEKLARDALKLKREP